MPRTKVNVCSNWHGNAGEEFTFENHNTDVCTVSSVSGQTWPFVQSSPITVPAKDQGGHAGETDCQLQTGLGNGTYNYNVDGCPANIRATVGKNVTIP